MMFPATFHHVDFSFEVNFSAVASCLSGGIHHIGTNDLIREAV